VLACVVACGGNAHPARPTPQPFDAHQLASRLDAAMHEIETVTRTLEHDCGRMVAELARVEERARGPIEEARVARGDPERARALSTELRAYNDAAAGRSDVIALRLAICWKQHGELHDQVQRVVDSLPTP
jgi:hypothetical protein